MVARFASLDQYENKLTIGIFSFWAKSEFQKLLVLIWIPNFRTPPIRR